MRSVSHLSFALPFVRLYPLRATALRAPVIAILCLLGCMSLDAMADYESPRYTVEGVLADNIELRSYEPMLLAEVTVAGDRGTASGRAFRILAGFIFGKNTSREKVAMTAPVTQTGVADDETAGAESQKIAMTVPVTQTANGSDTWRVSFMMPSQFTETTLPTPVDKRITVYTTSPYRVVALRFSGRHSDDNFNSHIDELREVARTRSLEIFGEPILAYYNGPFTLPFLRRNEVMFMIEDSL
ncbi:MAG: heme-binding protein [Pseudomonadota bacterium]